MRKRLQNYIQEMNQIEAKKLSEQEKATIRDQMLVQIQFFQHERLIHLIVTVTFAVLLMLSVLGFFISEEMIFLLLEAMLLILLIPYIRHYYFLENGVQKLYQIYDQFI